MCGGGLLNKKAAGTDPCSPVPLFSSSSPRPPKNPARAQHSFLFYSPLSPPSTPIHSACPIYPTAMLALKAASCHDLTAARLSRLRPRQVNRVVGVRLLAVVTNAPVPNKRKVWDSADEAVKDVKSGDIVLSGGAPWCFFLAGSQRHSMTTFFFCYCYYTGFGLSGIPETLLKALSKRTDVKDLIAVSNNAGAGDKGLGKRFCL
jgi:hypothetical protein